ncbi:MAG TPA: HAD-IC family P-type ATPase [bacterium]|nr:HAD-IC family P-type ATPase [bacterium]HNS48985.1 HAD-IC family P-type ATPase [bacterium]
MNNQWYRMTEKAVIEQLSSAFNGLSAAEAERRISEYGYNQLEMKKEETLFSIFIRQFKSPLIYILLFAALISFAVKKNTNGIVIFTVLMVNALTGFIQESRARKSMEALKKLSAPRTRVLRDGKTVEVATKNLVPGDVILLEAGTKIPADARVIKSVRLQVNESALTGESHPVYKMTGPIEDEVGVPEMLNMVFSGTVTVSGRGTAVVVETGPSTQIGQMAEIIQSAPESKTPFQRKVEKLGKFIILLVSLQISIVFLVGFLVRRLPFYDIFMVVLSQLVSSIPEGLPVALTVALAVGMQRMAKRKALIRKLYAVEGIGCVSVICSDKTGTLTRNEMTSKKLATVDTDEVEITGVGYLREGEVLIKGARPDLGREARDVEKLLTIGVLCNNAEAAVSGDNKELDVDGDPTEIAYLVAALKAGFDLEVLRKKYPRIDELPFDPDIRLMATVHNTPAGDHLVCVKGAPEKLVQLCGSYLASDGALKEMDAEGRAAIFRKAESLADSALRVLAFGYCSRAMEDLRHLEFDSLRGCLVFVGLIGNIDPPRLEVKKAIEDCRRAGIRTIMVTGDHLSTARAIGAELGIQGKSDPGLEGKDISRMSDEELAESLKTTSVFARIEPRHKFKIVQVLQKYGATVAMTGDGLNDAPALSAADIGVAMGITGTDIAKDASDIVIADDNFATIVNAVEEGRGITANMRKTLIYLLTSSNTEVLVLLTTMLVGLPLPLLPLMILWINLLTDGAQTVNLIMEPKEDVMSQPPDPKEEPLLTPQIWKRLLVRVPVMATGIFGLFFYELKIGTTLAYARTVAFTTLACSQWMNGLSSRSLTRSVFRMSLLSNKYLLYGLSVAVSLQLLVVYNPFFQRVFETQALKLIDWMKIIAASTAVLWAEEIKKYYRRRQAART